MRVVVPSRVLLQIRQHCTTTLGVETGGIVFGRRERDQVHVWFVSGPGPNAQLGARSLVWDASYILGVIEGATETGLVEPLGRWHKHVAPIYTASDDDKAGADAFRAVYDVANTFELIVATTDGDRPLAIGVYQCNHRDLELLEVLHL